MKKTMLLLLAFICMACSSSKHLGRTDLFILSQEEAVSFIEQEGFLAQKAKIIMDKGSPAWIITTPNSFIILSVYGHGYYFPQEGKSFRHIQGQYRFETGGLNLIILGNEKQHMKIIH